MVTLFLSSVLALAQNTPASPVEKKPPSLASPVEILTNTLGVDFGPYLKRQLRTVRENWQKLIPDEVRAPINKKGKLSIEFAIFKDGKVQGMRLATPSGDFQLDTAAWDGITASTPFPPLPAEFAGKYLGLRLTFWYNPDKSDLADSTTTQPSQLGLSKK
jgi:outer membrane biosynthesis protein TonB